MKWASVNNLFWKMENIWSSSKWRTKGGNWPTWGGQRWERSGMAEKLGECFKLTGKRILFKPYIIRPVTKDVLSSGSLVWCLTLLSFLCSLTSFLISNTYTYMKPDIIHIHCLCFLSSVLPLSLLLLPSLQRVLLLLKFLYILSWTFKPTENSHYLSQSVYLLTSFIFLFFSIISELRVIATGVWSDVSSSSYSLNLYVIVH